MNKWIANIMSHLRNINSMAFIYNDLLHEFGVASNNNIEALYKGKDSIMPAILNGA